MYLPYKGCLILRSTRTLIVLSAFADTTTPSTVRGWVGWSAISNLSLAHHGLYSSDVTFRLNYQMGLSQLLRCPLHSQIEVVFVQLGKLLR